MAGKPRTVDAQVEAANQIYAVAQEDANRKLQELQAEVDAVRQESFAQGAIRAMDGISAYNELMKHVTLYNIKKHKEYRKGGLTWEAFCESLGLDRRTVDRTLEDIAPLVKDFSDKMSVFCGIPFNKIRHLGRAISGQLSEIRGGAIVYGDETIPITPENAEEIQDLIEKLEDDFKAAREEAAAEISAKDKVLKAKEEVIKRQDKDLIRFEKQARAKNLSPEEDALLGKIETLGIELDGYCLMTENVLDALREKPTANAVAAFISLADGIRMRIGAFREIAALELAQAGMLPDEEWQPPNVRDVIEIDRG